MGSLFLISDEVVVAVCFGVCVVAVVSVSTGGAVLGLVGTCDVVCVGVAGEDSIACSFVGLKRGLGAAAEEEDDRSCSRADAGEFICCNSDGDPFFRRSRKREAAA